MIIKICNYIIGSYAVFFFATSAYGQSSHSRADNGNNTTSPPFKVYTPALTSTDQNPAANFWNITYSDGALEAGHTGYYTFSGVVCSSGIPNQSAHHKNDKPQSIQNDTSSVHCYDIIHEGDALRQSKSYQAAYDRYRDFIDTCAYLSNSWEFFSEVGSANAQRNGDLHRFEEYREWLKKVLYYSLDTNYYCADVNQMFSTFSWFNDQRGDDERGVLAVISFLAKTNRCPKATAYYDTVSIPAGWRDIYSKWQDTISNNNMTPFDSTLPSLEDLGLGILRGPPADVKKFIDAKLGPIMSNIIALENPFSSETKIDFTCREAAAIRIEIFDVLGKRFYNSEKVFDGGDNQVLLSGEGLPHGELFARFSASDGTVRTIKLQHY